MRETRLASAMETVANVLL